MPEQFIFDLILSSLSLFTDKLSKIVEDKTTILKLQNAGEKLRKFMSQKLDIYEYEKIDKYLSVNQIYPELQCLDKTISETKKRNIISAFYKANPTFKCMSTTISPVISKLIDESYYAITKCLDAQQRILYLQAEENTENIRSYMSELSRKFDQIVNYKIDDDNDIKDFCELIRTRLSTRIDHILCFYATSYSMFGFGSIKSNQELLNKIKVILNLDEQYNTRVDKILKNIEKCNKFVNYLCEEYLETEKNFINCFINDFDIPQNWYYEKHNETYHLYLRKKINVLISQYNAINKKMCDKYSLIDSSKDLFENQDDIYFFYNNITELKDKLSEIKYAKEQKYPRVIVFCCDSVINNIERNLFSEDCVILKLDSFTDVDIFNYIEWTNEAFTQEGSFGPQLYMRYVVFIGYVSDDLKSKLEKFKNRSTIKYIFVEKIKCEIC